MGRERKYMIGLSNSTTSISYIIGPILAGGLAAFFGEKQTFLIIGILIVVVSLFLYFLIPKKLKIPQKEIKNWNKL